jgi:hypothetical protein
MRTMQLLILLVSAGAATAIPAQTPAPQVYPAKQQSAEQQATDERECQAWATTETGYDPANPPTVAAAQPAPVTGSGARVRGAAAGATVAAVGDNDVSNGAAKGAVAGAVVRRSRNRRAAAAQNDAAAQQVQASADAYARAHQACLEGRGYTVR